MNLPWHDNKFKWLIFSVVVVVSLEVLNLVGYEIPAPFNFLFFGTVILIIGHSVLWSGVKALFRLNFSSINLLMLIAVIAAFYLGEYTEAAVVIVLYVLSEELEDIGIANSKSAINQLIDQSPKKVLLQTSNTEVPVDKVPVGSIFVVKPHSILPLDGIVVSGLSHIDESPITGEPIAKLRQEDDLVFAGTKNQNGSLLVKSTKTHEDSAFSKIVTLTFQSLANRANIQQFISRFARVYTPVIIVLAMLVLAIPTLVFNLDFNHWLEQAVTLLVIACPCALVISTPVAIYSAIGNASGKGALIKGGKYLEQLAKASIICLDKTGTLTTGRPVVSDLISLNNTTTEELLACTAGAEQYSEHPIAQAIVNATSEAGFTPHRTTGFHSVVGKGATAKCLDCPEETIYVGNLEYLKENNFESEVANKHVSQLAGEGKSSVVVSFGSSINGIFGISDEMKSNSPITIQKLHDLNISTVLLTGDNVESGNHLGARIGIQKVYGNLLPEHKRDIVLSLKAAGQVVLMAGDGINDAPAMAAADISISMASLGSDIAIEVSDVALMNDNPELIPFLVELGRKTLQRIKTNTFLAISVKIIFILLAFMGYSSLFFAILADVGVTLIVILTSLLLMKFNGNFTPANNTKS